MPNWTKVIERVKNDCKTRTRYIRRIKNRKTGEIEEYTCAIGDLALAAGVSKEVLYAAGGTGIGVDAYDGAYRPQSEIEAVVKIRDAIEKTFGLNKHHMLGIQAANDYSERTPARRKRVLEAIARMQSNPEFYEE